MAVVTDLDSVNWEVSNIMKRLYGDRLAKIVLYGSYARGDFNEESDVDYLVILDDENVSSFAEVDHIRPALRDYYLNSFIPISAFAVANKSLVESKRPFFNEVRKDGRTIYERVLEPLHKKS